MRHDYLKLASLVKEVKNNNSQAFSRLYEVTYQKLYFFCYSILKNEEDAQDALQEAYIKIFESIHTLENEKLFVAWMNKIAYNICIRMLERKKTDLPGDEFFHAIPDDSRTSSPEESVIQSSKAAYLNTLINQLDPVLRSTLVLKYFEGLKLEQIALIMDCPVGTVKSRLHTAKKMLKASIHKERKGSILFQLLTVFSIKKALGLAARQTPLKVHAADAVFDGVVANTALPESLTFSPQAAALPAATLSTTIAGTGIVTGFAATVTAGSLILTPPSITEVSVHTPETAFTREPVTISATIEAPLNSIKQVYAVSDHNNEVVYGTMVDKETAHFEVTANGNYTLYAIGSNDEQTSVRVSVSCIDREIVTLRDYTYTSETVTFYLEDSQSGVDYDSVFGEGPDGSRFYPAQTDSTSGKLVFAFPETDFDLHVSDMAGNKAVFHIERFIE